ncbi:Rap1a/Tai family immunity protein [Mesorhizobium sp.]|uniref:Rap1a/Tai family immunity protein n=1 Tax=Mesorhizobium sp. TaxID=1871066 RepID=UPI00345BF829
MCLAGPNGVREGFVINRGKGCIPSGATNDQLAEVVIKYLGDHPEELHYPAAPLSMVAIAKAFPCP